MDTVQTAIRVPADLLRRIDHAVKIANRRSGGLSRASRTSVIVALIERALPEVETEFSTP